MWTEKHLQELQEKNKIRGYQIISGSKPEVKDIKTPKASKYGSKKSWVDDIEFDSIKEANRYKELRLLAKVGKIGLLELQVPYELNAGGTHSLKYIADFVYYDSNTGEKIVEDCKGYRTKEYKKKRRLMKKIYGIIIKET